ncbi:HAMP domain-containing histidine kinase [Chloroflexi bacterium TSY]|nr:HAMP domain-containing histidine kinase [Chloroflexi bacterium TSY]
MSNPSLRTRIFLSYFLLIALSAILINWFSIRQIVALADESFYEGFNRKIEQIVETLEDLLGEQVEPDAYNVESVQQEIIRLANRLKVHISLIDPEGDFVLFDSDLERGDYPAGDWEELWTLIHDDDPTNVDYDWLDRVYRAEYLFYTNVDDDEEVIIVRVGESWLSIQTQIRNRRLALAATSVIIGTILLFGLGGWLANALTQPLIQLRESAQAMASGNLNTRSNTNAPKEISMLADDFNRMAEAIESMMAEQKAFASNAAHELRTPLTAIRIRTETLLEDDPDPTLTEQYIQEIDDEARRLSRLVDDLRLLSRSDAHNLVVGNDEIDVGRLLQAIQEEFTVQIAEKDLSYSAAIPMVPIIVPASVTHLRVMLRNLIENAIKYTPTDGAIEVTLEQVVQDETDQMADMPPREIFVTITDTGIGISAEDLPLIFNRFYRVDKARNRKISGSGLGLSLVQSIVELYGGRVQIESEGLGKGTMVRLVLPVDGQRR